MKVYITADMEGATGITNGDQTGPEGKDYNRARDWLTGDVNAAVAGALDGGATDILVADSHGNMRNILLEKLHPEARLLAGSGLERELVQLEGIDETYDAAVLVAFHAMAGNDRGVMSHTWIGGIVREIRLNDILLGETGLAAATAGRFGVPVVAVAGDRAVCEEALALLPGVSTAEVKEGWGRGLAVCLPPAKTEERIRTAVKKGLADPIPPYRVKEPCELTMRFTRPILARQAAKSLSAEVWEEDGVKVQSESVLDSLKLAWRMAYIGAFDDRGLRTW